MVTPLRISTMTAVCDIGTNIILKDLYESLSINDIIKCVRFQNKPVKGEFKKKNKKKQTKSFYNQLTIILHIINKNINMKVFKNGKVQITGLKSEEQGREACKYISNIIKNNNEIFNYRTVLINSDFNIGFEINREKLYNLLVQNYNMFVSFEPCIYPGVNAKFYWNTNHTHEKGICKCKNRCEGKGSGTGDGNCKRITIASFQSGTIIITGANTKPQLYDVYHFILDLCMKHKSTIIKKKIDIHKQDKQVTSKSYVIKKSSTLIKS